MGATIGIRRHYSSEGTHPYDEVVWERRDARITNFADGAVAFEQAGVEVPAAWSFNATNILAQKYFRGEPGTPARETSLRQVVDRVVDTITAWGEREGYFVDRAEARAFSDELKWLIVNQRVAFNSPVWFNIGVPGVPAQASACFILAVSDDMRSILNWYTEEGIIFKGGSGAGVNLSTIRSARESMSGGGKPSGPVSFMRGADASAGTIRSGGKTRRAAKMVILNVDHPDICDFVWCKAAEERKARALAAAGFDMGIDGRDIHSVQYQNANNSVRVTDAFMRAVADDASWELRAVTTGDVLEKVRARDLWRQIAQASWECADPGVQFDTTINRWHTCPASGRINASNPCSEYMHVDNSACNLASLNLLSFLEEGGSFDSHGFKAAVEVLFTAQEILVGNADYPTERIGENARRFRQLGIGYANLGALLMALGLAYDSDEGRAWAGAITALMTGQAYATSARTAARMGPFGAFGENREAMLGVLGMHRAEVAVIDEEAVPTEVLSAAQEAWDSAVALAERHGVRNSQASVLAPTGTISFLMDCDTTGIEPDLSLVKTKRLVGGGTMSIVNQTVPRALRRLGYGPEQVAAIVAFIDEHKSIVGAPGLAPEHLGVFACSMGDNTIHHMGHVRMMAAAQPFVSGAISKCVVGDTLISAADGLVRIGSLHQSEAPDTFRDEVVEVVSLGGSRKTDAFYYGGVRPVREVVLRSGHRMTGTLNHRVLVAASGALEWRDLSELSRGDWVALKYGDDMWSSVPASLGFIPSDRHGSQVSVTIPSAMSVELAFLLGAYASEGHTARSVWTVRITNAVEAVLLKVAQTARRVFGVAAPIRRPAARRPYVEISSKSVVELLEHLGCGSRASAKRIPDTVLRSPRPMVMAFLQGLALDAYATSDHAAKWAICLDAPRLLDDLQAVLTNLGIVHGRITKHNSVNGKDYDEVYAAGREAQRLAAAVPFLEADKAAAAGRLVGRVFGQSTADVVPGLCPRDLYRLVPYARRNSAGTLLRTEFNFLTDARTRWVSRHTLERVASIPGVELPPWLRTVLDDRLHFSPIASITEAGLAEVYDLSVPEAHAFVGNGIVNHNTVNLPQDVTVEDVEQVHLDAWRLGLKAVAVYRDNCKVAQPLETTKRAPVAVVPVAAVPGGSARPVRERLPRRRRSSTFKFQVADCEGYVTVGEYVDGRPGEVFMKVSKQGSTLAGVMDAFSVAISIGLQHGVPLATFVGKYINMRFEPAGLTDDPDIRLATSLVDYIFRRLAVDYLSLDERVELGIQTTGERAQPSLPGLEAAGAASSGLVETPISASDRVGAERVRRAEPGDAPYCYQCGNVMQPAGACYVCATCGTTSGCS